MLTLKPSLDEKVKVIFDLMDTDHNGSVDINEFKVFLREEKNKNTQAMLVRAMRQDKKQMSLDEFRSFFAENIRYN